MFADYPTHSRYRTLKLATPMMRGPDVYALQTALQELGSDPGVADGWLGKNTAAAIRRGQQALDITVDGLAGGGTQTALVRYLADRARTKHRLPIGLVFGQVMHESSCRLGNYSPQHSHSAPGGPYYDAGPAQRNTRFTDPKDGFTVPASIEALGANLRRHFDKYAGLSTRRRWELAAASWNAPAYASYIAREEGATSVQARETARPSGAARATLERYIDSATAYLRLP